MIEPLVEPKPRPDRAPYAITVVFELEDGAFDVFHPLICENAAQSVALEPGCLRFDVLTPQGGPAPSEVLLYEIYVDRAAFDLHLASPHFLAFDEKSRHLVRGKMIAVFDLVENAKAGVEAPETGLTA